MAMVLRSLYLDPKIDIALGNRADSEGITKAELMRRFLVQGLERPGGVFAAYDTPTPADTEDVADVKRKKKLEKAKKPQPERRVASSAKR